MRLGLDAGGTRTRAVLVDGVGEVLGRGTAAGANPAGSDPDAALATLATAVTAALATRDPATVTGCLIGLAGHRSLPDPAEFADRCRAALQLRCPVRVVPDVVPALAAGGVPDGTGTVLIAGTGSICVRLAGHRPRTQRGGLGWLLGDEGSGFWLGRGALRAAIEYPAGALAAAVRRECAADSPRELVRWAYAGPPRRLAALAPLVSAAALDGDPAAVALVETAAGELAALVRATAVCGEPLILAGSVAAGPGPIRERLLGGLADLAPRLPVIDAATAAARLVGVG
ncbi:ATPase [Kitasatospora sp. RB6PN24]|uniref:N-acetylglucosamine kinase n=1 Tax=Kitasatospora humi TaxID=2893891 RepID=UPI001E50CB6D|nr:BadF/BadG/BcrA/BcrD ATPase family protein [Kitasatospora humi]MCC9308849.1 ATPase [Kitasatospora humi]